MAKVMRNGLCRVEIWLNPDDLTELERQAGECRPSVDKKPYMQYILSEQAQKGKAERERHKTDIAP